MSRASFNRRCSNRRNVEMPPEPVAILRADEHKALKKMNLRLNRRFEFSLMASKMIAKLCYLTPIETALPSLAFHPSLGPVHPRICGVPAAAAAAERSQAGLSETEERE
jgi:hypothetical protein